MNIFEKHNIYVYDLNIILSETSKEVGDYIIKTDHDFVFDFSKRDSKRLYTHFFLKTICKFLLKCSDKHKVIFYYNKIQHEQLPEEEFVLKLIEKIKKIFGIKIWVGVRNHLEFIDELKNNKLGIIDEFELFVLKNNKPKTMKHVKRFLQQEGLKELSDKFFENLTNKMIILT